MSEPAAKEPSMEDILSSIRKIIADEGSLVQDNNSAPEFSPEVSESNTVIPDVSEQSEMPSFEPEAISQDEPLINSAAQPDEVDGQAEETLRDESSDFESDSPSGSDAAKLIGSLASIAETVKSSAVPQDDFSDEVAEAYEEAPELESQSASEFSSSDDTEVAEAEQPVTQSTQPPNDALAALRSEAPAVDMKDAEKTLAEFVKATAPKVQLEVPALQSAVEASDEETEAFKGALVSPSTEAAVSDSFDRLKQSAIGDMDAKAEAILRPMLREWMDENLPSLVEKIVREEVERIARDS